ncbi:hypothetical protein D3C83_141660 [compost metagenome]
MEYAALSPGARMTSSKLWSSMTAMPARLETPGNQLGGSRTNWPPSSLNATSHNPVIPGTSMRTLWRL